MKLQDALIILACSLIVLWAVVSNAEDVHLTPVAGVYPVGCQDISGAPDIAELCFARVDEPVVLEYSCHAAGPNVTVRTELTVIATPNKDATIVCYALDTAGLVSDYSNPGRIDFTRPGAPRLIARRFPSCAKPVFVFRS